MELQFVEEFSHGNSIFNLPIDWIIANRGKHGMPLNVKGEMNHTHAIKLYEKGNKSYFEYLVFVENDPI